MQASHSATNSQALLREDTNRTSGDTARRYNLLAARLIAELVKNSLGPFGMEKLLIDIFGEVTLTKDGATVLRKIDVEHPAAKVLIEASNTVDNEVGDGTKAVVVLAGALVERAEEMLDTGISPAQIIDGYCLGLDLSLEILEKMSVNYSCSDRLVMTRLVETCLNSKALLMSGNHIVQMLVEAASAVADFDSGTIATDDIKIEEKIGNISATALVQGIVIDKTVDSSSMPREVENARILLIDDDLEGKTTKADAQITILKPHQLKTFKDAESEFIRSKVRHIIDSGANVVFSRRGINTLAQQLLAQAGIMSVRRVKENDLQWLAKATGATIAERLDHSHEHAEFHHHDHFHEHASTHHHTHEHSDDERLYHHADIDLRLGLAARVIERAVGDDRMVFVEGCKKPKAVTVLLRAGSKRTLDELHRSAIDGISVLRDFVTQPKVVPGGGSTEALIAKILRDKANLIDSREQLVLKKFADALEEIPLTIARNAGMNPADTITALRHSTAKADLQGNKISFGVDVKKRRIGPVLPWLIEPAVVKEQVLKSAVEVTNLLLRIDDVLTAKPAMTTHTHDDGTRHSHKGGDKEHQHDYFDKLGKKQRPSHHYY